MTQQPLFAPEAAAIAGQVAVAADNAVARRNERKGILAVGGADGADRFGIAQGVGNGLVGGCRAIGDGQQLTPDLALEGRPVKVQWEVKDLTLVRKVFSQLGQGGGQQGVGAHGVTRSFDKVQGRNRRGVGPNLHQAHRGGIVGKVGCPGGALVNRWTLCRVHSLPRYGLILGMFRNVPGDKAAEGYYGEALCFGILQAKLHHLRSNSPTAIGNGGFGMGKIDRITVAPISSHSHLSTQIRLKALGSCVMDNRYLHCRFSHRILSYAY